MSLSSLYHSSSFLLSATPLCTSPRPTCRTRHASRPIPTVSSPTSIHLVLTSHLYRYLALRVRCIDGYVSCRCLEVCSLSLGQDLHIDCTMRRIVLGLYLHLPVYLSRHACLHSFFLSFSVVSQDAFNSRFVFRLER